MAYKLIWSPAARDDLRDIVSYIARDSQQRAEAFGYRLMREAEKLADFPELGRMVPEYHLHSVRELIVRSYRIVYRIHSSQQCVEISRIWHGARGTPELEE